MRIHICLISSDSGAIELVRRDRISLIPKSLREHQRMREIGADFSFTVYDPVTAGRPLANYLLEGEGDQVIVLLVDLALESLISDIASACFVAGVEFRSHPRTNYKNYLAGILTRLLKNMATFLSIIDDGANKQVMLLPFRNFDAEELRALRQAVRVSALSSEIDNAIMPFVVRLKDRKRPRRKSNFPGQYIVDDEGKLFQFGLERHSQLATGSPHTASCILTGRFRFGRRIETDRHYNVTKEVGQRTEISGEFLGCHSQLYTVSTTTHLNMFSNDYVA